jgi:hypothetical protein
MGKGPGSARPGLDLEIKFDQDASAYEQQDAA